MFGTASCFGHMAVGLEGLTKNASQIFTWFALSDQAFGPLQFSAATRTG